MLESIEATFTTDVSKKRKKWNDAICEINHATRLLRVVDEAKKTIHSSIIEPSKFSSLLEASDEVRVGHILIILERQSSHFRTDLSKLNPTVRSKLIAPRFQSSMLSDRNPIPKIKLSHPLGELSSELEHKNEPFKQIMTSRPFKVPTSTSRIISSTTSKVASSTSSALVYSRKSDDYGTSSRSQSSSVPYKVPDYYELLTRKIFIDDRFDNKINYAFQFAAAIEEEIILNVLSTFKSLDWKTRHALGIVSGEIKDNNHPLIQKRPQVEAVKEMLRRVGIPFSVHVDICVSPPKDDNYHSSTSSSKSWDSTASKKDNDEDDSENKGENKLYLKLPLSDVRQPKGADLFGKGDIWVLWRPETDVKSPECILFNGGVSTVESSLTKIQEKRDEFIRLRSQVGYPLPWHDGIVWQDIWFVRSLWYSISDKGMTEAVFLNGSKDIPLEMGTLPRGKSRGNLDVKFSAIRVLNDMNSLTTYDFVNSGVRGTLGSNDTCDDFTTLKFSDLHDSAVFNESIISRSLDSASSAKDSVLEPRPSRQVVSNKVSLSSSKQCHFPTLPRTIVSKDVQDVCTLFRLNIDQAEVVNRVGAWFMNQSDHVDDNKEIEEGNGNIIMVHGVFGSGKSHLIVAICVLIKVLSTRLRSNNLSSNTSGTRLHPTSVPVVPFKCLLSANTNIAVDRVMLELAQMNTHEFAPTRVQESQNIEAVTCEEDPENEDKLKCLPIPKIARIGCALKINKELRKHLLLINYTSSRAQKELEQCIKKDPDPIFKKMLESAKRSDFMSNQRKLLHDADVVGVTCASCINSAFQGIKFPILILDEASQSTEPLSLLSLACSKASRMIIVGDPKQLPPTIVSAQPVLSGASRPTQDNSLQRTLFDRMLALGIRKVTLRTQYRCHPAIANICSKLFYDDELINGVAPDQRCPLVPRLPPVVIIKCSGQERKIGESYINTQEASKIQELTLWIYSARKDSAPISIGIVCIYKAQADNIRRSFEGLSPDILANVTVSTVDAFQGMEMDIVIISTCRTTSTSFGLNSSRVNVALSRARYHLFVIGSNQTFQQDPWLTVESLSSCSATSIEKLVDMCAANQKTNLVSKYSFPQTKLLNTDITKFPNNATQSFSCGDELTKELEDAQAGLDGGCIQLSGSLSTFQPPTIDDCDANSSTSSSSSGSSSSSSSSSSASNVYAMNSSRTEPHSMRMASAVDLDEMIQDAIEFENWKYQVNQQSTENMSQHSMLDKVNSKMLDSQSVVISSNNCSSESQKLPNKMTTSVVTLKPTGMAISPSKRPRVEGKANNENFDARRRRTAPVEANSCLSKRQGQRMPLNSHIPFESINKNLSI